MNLIAYFVGMFPNRRRTSELETVRLAGEDQGRAFASAFCDGFDGGVSSVFHERAQRHIGYDPDVVDAEFEVEPEPVKPARRKPVKRSAKRKVAR